MDQLVRGLSTQNTQLVDELFRDGKLLKYNQIKPNILCFYIKHYNGVIFHSTYRLYYLHIKTLYVFYMFKIETLNNAFNMYHQSSSFGTLIIKIL